MSVPSFIKTDLETWLQSFHFNTPYQTRFGETDAYGHINNVSYFEYFQEARIDYFKGLKLYDYLNISNQGDEILSENMVVTANLECHYVNQLFYGQEINIHVRTSHIGNSSFELEYAIIESENKACIAVGRGSIVYINKKTNKSTPLPEAFKQIIAKFENKND